ncbi:hypothetical protein AAY80_211 [Stenotrophomonas phage vB_SmaS-DLP_6]|nr:hypothetical protein AAY80_211 [Stenotrophomonas phage vB_SmaS-DLP_6]
MSQFVIVDEVSKAMVFGGKTYKTAGGANRSALAYIKRRLRAFDNGNKSALHDAQEAAKNWSVMTIELYNSEFRTTKKVINMMSGKEIEIDVNTPACCDPSTETYWSM